MHHPVHTASYCAHMQNRDEETAMIHYQCHTCGITATCVVTPVSDLAWLDHMDQHGAKTNYSAWTWAVIPLPLG